MVAIVSADRTKQEDEALRIDIGEENLRLVRKLQARNQLRMTIAPAIYGVDAVVNAVCLKLQQRSAFGVAKYGTTLQDSKESRLAFLNHAQQEAMDLANYLEVLIQRENA